MPDPGRSAAATGAIADLFAEAVGFYATWGFSRTITEISPRLLTAAGDVDWPGADARVQAALADVLAIPQPGPGRYPDGILGFGPDLFAGVAVGQHFSGWAPARGGRGKRLVLLRDHVGKQRVAGNPINAVLIQYRVWSKTGNDKPEQVLEAAKAWPLLRDLHTEIERRLAE